MRSIYPDCEPYMNGRFDGAVSVRAALEALFKLGTEECHVDVYLKQELKTYSGMGSLAMSSHSKCYDQFTRSFLSERHRDMDEFRNGFHIVFRPGIFLGRIVRILVPIFSFDSLEK